MLNPTEHQGRSAGTVAAPSPVTSAASVELPERRPAMPPTWCRHNHLTTNCRICFGAWEAAMLPAAKRL
jgi:hypothetical protein